MFGKFCHNLPDTTLEWCHLEGRAGLVVIDVRADQVARLIKVLAFMKDGRGGVQFIGVRSGHGKVVGATAASGVAGVVASRSFAIVLFLFQ